MGFERGSESVRRGGNVLDLNDGCLEAILDVFCIGEEKCSRLATQICNPVSNARLTENALQ